MEDGIRNDYTPDEGVTPAELRALIEVAEREREIWEHNHPLTLGTESVV